MGDEAAFKAGDVVRLRGDATPMTVERVFRIDDGSPWLCELLWFHEGDIHEATLSQAVLVEHKP